MENKTFKDKHSSISVEVFENGWITIIEEDNNHISLGTIDGIRCQLIKQAFDYADGMENGKQ